MSVRNVMITDACCRDCSIYAFSIVEGVLVHARFAGLTHTFDCQVVIEVAYIDRSETGWKVPVLDYVVIGAFCAASLGVDEVSAVYLVTSSFDALGWIVWASKESIRTNVVVCPVFGVLSDIVDSTTTSTAVFHS